MVVAGVDGCPAGWVVVLLDVNAGTTNLRVVRTFGEILKLPESPAESSYTYKPQVPFGLAPLKTERLVPYGPGCAGDGMASLGGKSVGLYEPDKI